MLLFIAVLDEKNHGVIHLFQYLKWNKLCYTRSSLCNKRKKYDDNKHEEGINVFLLKYEKLVQEYIYDADLTSTKK